MRRHIVVAALVTTCLGTVGYQQVKSQTGAASLTGTVTSEAEGAMEGVLVSAKAVGSTVRVTVVTDRQGRYVFPRERLMPGRYQLSIRATGYDLQDSGPAEVRANTTTDVNLQLRKTTDLGAQLMNAEWIASWPGTAEEKQYASGCVACHSLETTTRTRHDARQWLAVLARMSLHPNGSSLLMPFDSPSSPKYAKDLGPYASQATPTVAAAVDDEGVPSVVSPRQAAQADYLASINLGSDRTATTWKYALKTLPRPTGDETRVIMTEYDLPRRSTQPHDVTVDAEGMVWFEDFGDNWVGRLNPKTGEVKEWPIPATRPFPPFHPGSLDIALDRDGNPWLPMMRQASVAKLDKKTGKVTTYSFPQEYQQLGATAIMVAPTAAGDVWVARLMQGGGAATSAPAASVHLLDPKTGGWKNYPVPSGVYGLEALPNGNAMVFSLQGGVLVEVDAATGKNTVYTPPTERAGPRRGAIDASGRAWFAEYRAGKIGMFDPKTKAFKEWAIPQYGPSDPYAAAVDENGEAWTGGMYTDYLFRLNPATGKVTKYMMPTVNVNVRRVDVDGSRRPAVWIGANHHAKIIKIEPLD
jgi:virginiamycin B lyase